MSMRVCLFSLALSAVFAVLAEPAKVVPATGTVGGDGYNEPEKGVRKTAAKPAEGVSGAPPINDGRPAYLAQPWESAAIVTMATPAIQAGERPRSDSHQAAAPRPYEPRK